MPLPGRYFFWRVVTGGLSMVHAPATGRASTASPLIVASILSSPRQ